MEFIQTNIWLITIAVVSGVMLVWPGFRQAGKRLSPTLATQLMNREDAAVIDVRDAPEYAAGHILNARNIPLKDLPTRATELDALKEKPLLVVCASGTRAGQACARLQKLGFVQLNALDGGMSAWERAGLPVKRGNKKK
ncbi:MAG: rhodanese-like domain-containing protein [Zoogloeaceae bacterium]|jgi:rhodanese-related sulfurtransferase|nr:rhodanese-like domain-containing protein [Zoogloeaceae bacterium]